MAAFARDLPVAERPSADRGETRLPSRSPGGGQEAAFGRELWRVGLIVDNSEPARIRANLDWNASPSRERR